MPKRHTKSRRSIDIDNESLIRHHLEEASTHLGMVKQLDPNMEASITKIGKLLKLFYVRHGGHPDA